MRAMPRTPTCGARDEDGRVGVREFLLHLLDEVVVVLADDHLLLLLGVPHLGGEWGVSTRSTNKFGGVGWGGVGEGSGIS